MGLTHEPSRLYEFLPSHGERDSRDGLPTLPALIADGMQELADLAIAKEAPANGSTWQARLYIYGESGAATDTQSGTEIETDTGKIAERYLAHLGSTGVRESRLLELDRPLHQSPSGASNIRLTVAAPANTPQSGYNYELTMYTPRPHRDQSGADLRFDEELYQQIMAEGRHEPHEAERAVMAHMKAQESKTSLSVQASLPRIALSDIYSRHSLIRSKNDAGPDPGLYTHIYNHRDDPIVENFIPVDASDQLESAYEVARPNLGTWQRILLDTRGAESAMHFDLSLALRHLGGDKLTYTDSSTRIQVDDLREAVQSVLDAGGKKVSKLIVLRESRAVLQLVEDPEGNLIEYWYNLPGRHKPAARLAKAA